MGNEKYIVACINGLPPSDAVCDCATWVAGVASKQVKLFHSLDHHSNEQKSDLSGSIGLGARSGLLDELVEKEHEQNKLLNQQAKEILENAKVRAEAAGAIDPNLCLRSGLLIENLIDLKDEISMAVIGRFGQNHQEKIQQESVGHHVEAVIRSLDSPVMVVSKEFIEPSKVLLAYDGSKGATKALNYICEQPIFKGKEIHVVYTRQKSAEAEEILKQATDALTEVYKNVKSVYLEGSAIETLFSYVSENQINMMVMGAFGHNRLHDFIKGSFTSKMLVKSEVPLLLVR